MSSMGTHTSGEITLLLQQMGGGDTQASEKLLRLVLPELRALARHYLRGERPGHTLQPTALVNEAYLRLVSGPQAPGTQAGRPTGTDRNFRRTRRALR